MSMKGATDKLMDQVMAVRFCIFVMDVMTANASPKLSNLLGNENAVSLSMNSDVKNIHMEDRICKYPQDRLAYSVSYFEFVC